MHRLIIIALGGLTWLWMTAWAGAQAVQPHGGIAPYKYLEALVPISWNVNTVHGAAEVDYRDVIVGYSFHDEPGTENDRYVPWSPTMNFIFDPLLAVSHPATHGQGGVVQYSTYIYNESVVNLKGGIMISRNGSSDGVFLFDKSKLNVSGGTVLGLIRTSDDSKVEITGGAVRRLVAEGNSTIELTGTTSSSVAQLAANGKSRVTASVAGLLVTVAQASGSGQLTLSDATVVNLALADGDSQAHLTNVTLRDALVANGNIVTHTGGSVGTFVQAKSNSTITLTGVAVAGEVVAGDMSSINLNGGSVGGDITTYDHGEIYLTGTTVAGDVEIGRADIDDDFGLLNMDSGSIQENVKLFGNALFNMSGGHVSYITAHDTAIADLNDGTTKQVAATEDSNVHLNGVRVESQAYAESKGTLRISGGLIHSLLARQEATTILTGGVISGGIELGDSGKMFARGGLIGGPAILRGDSRLFISGATFSQSVDADETGDVVLISGSIVKNLSAGGQAEINMGDGFVGGNLIAHGTSTINLDGGTVAAHLTGSDKSTIYMRGGAVLGGAAIVDMARLNWIGGTIGGEPPPQQSTADLFTHGQASASHLASAITVSGSATLNIFGTQLEAILVDANHEDNFSLYELVGTLADGTPVGGQYFAVQNTTGASFRLLPPPVPEPTSVVLLATFLALSFLRRPRLDSAIH